MVAGQESLLLPAGVAEQKRGRRGERRFLFINPHTFSNVFHPEWQRLLLVLLQGVAARFPVPAVFPTSGPQRACKRTLDFSKSVTCNPLSQGKMAHLKRSVTDEKGAARPEPQAVEQVDTGGCCGVGELEAGHWQEGRGTRAVGWQLSQCPVGPHRGLTVPWVGRNVEL